MVGYLIRHPGSSSKPSFLNGDVMKEKLKDALLWASCKIVEISENKNEDWPKF